MSSRFLYHRPCPQCGSKDNLGVWEDGHKYCFGCRYHEAGTINLRQVFHPVPEDTKPYAFPHDAQESMPVEPLKWLLSCGVTFQLQRKHGFSWSPSRQMVVWRIVSPSGKDLGWQGRCFSKDAKTKYFIAGKVHDDVCIIGEGNTTVVLVEDYLSAVRVSEHLPCVPLFGCTCGLNVLGELKKRFNKVVVWLDSDKLDNSRKIASNAALVGLEESVVYTPKDPKEYTKDELASYLEVVK